MVKKHMVPTTEEGFLGCLKSLRTWKRQSEQAYHKPLLLLYAIRKAANCDDRLTPFGVLEYPLTRLLRKYGCCKPPYRPEYPFWRMQNDGVWEVTVDSSTSRTTDRDVPARWLRAHNAKGGFPHALYDLLRQNRSFANAAFETVLQKYFPAELHEGLRKEPLP